MRPKDWPPLLFAFLYVAVSSFFAFRGGNQEFVFYIVVMVVLIALVGVVHLQVQLHLLALWGLSLWGFLHMAGGLVPLPGDGGVLYNLWLIPSRLKYDQVVHAFGFALCTWIAWQGMRRRLADPTPTAGMLLIAACAGMGLGAANEVVEFAATLLVPETNVGGYGNTGWDLVANTVGATIAASLIRLLDSGAKAV